MEEELKAQGVSAGANSNLLVLIASVAHRDGAASMAASTRSISLQAMVSVQESFVTAAAAAASGGGQRAVPARGVGAG